MNGCHHWCIQVAAQPATVSQLIQSSSIQCDQASACGNLWIGPWSYHRVRGPCLEELAVPWGLDGGSGGVGGNEANALITSNLGSQGLSFLLSP